MPNSLSLLYASGSLRKFNNLQANSLGIRTGNWKPEQGKFPDYQAEHDLEHPTCSMNHLGISSQLSEIASSLAVEAEVPIGNTCCGTAGDRGLLHPELVVSGTRDTKAVLDAKPADAYISANRTCEMGLLHATGRALCIAAAALAWPSRQFQWRSRDGGSGRPPTFDQFQFAG